MSIHGMNGDLHIELSAIGTFETGQGEASAEIVAHDPDTQRLFITNSAARTVDILDISNPSEPVTFASIDVSVIGGRQTAGANSVAIANGIVAVAIEAETLTDNGMVAFFNTQGDFLGAVDVGALPDMVTFTPDGQTVLVANEASPDPDTGIDPKGSVSIIDISGGIENATVVTAGFTAFDAQQEALEDAGLRIFPGELLSDDVEPEFIAVSEDGSQAFVTLQEANAVAVLDLETNTIVEIQPLGFKDHSLPGNGLDASDRDDAINIQNWPVFGIYMPDGIATYDAGGQTYYVTANEGDARLEEVRVKDLVLDPIAFPNAAELQEDENLGRLTVSAIDGDIDNDGEYEELYVYGARSFSIFDASGNLVFDSGDQFEQIIADLEPEFFNANDGDPEEFDNRSDNKGPEPEGVVIGEVNGRTYAFIGLERATGGVMTYDITDPLNVSFVQFIRNDGDIAPEGLDFIAAEDSPTGFPLLAVANEFSGTTTLYQIDFDPSDVEPGPGGVLIEADDDGEEIEGGRGDDVLIGGDGDDRIDGDRGNDTIFTGDGDNEVFGDRGDDTIIANGDGDNVIDGGRDDDKIYGGEGDDRIFGDRGEDLIFGGGGDDFIDGGRDDDTIYGGDGDDEIFGDRGNDLIFGGAGDDFIDGGRDDDTLHGGEGDDEIFGDRGEDILYGDDGDDLLDGGRDDDQLFGGRGNDRLIGGHGDDFLDGGEGIDTAVYFGDFEDYLVDLDEGLITDLRGGSPDGTDRFVNIEFLEFADQTVSIVPEVEVNFTLELLHFSDQEGSTSSIVNAPNLSAVLNALRGQDLGNDGIADNTLTLSSGDLFIPGVFASASAAIYGAAGIADLQIQNELGVQASALGNHDFDFGPAALADLIDGSAGTGRTILGADYAGTAFPYLSTNLNFAPNPDLGPLEIEGGQAPQGGVVSSSTVIDVNGEPIGIVGATTPTLARISSPGNVGVLPSPFDNNPTPEQLDALAAIIQAEVDALLAANPDMNKVILLAHMQVLDIELALAERLENVDIIVAGGSNTRLFDDNDRPRDGDSDQGQYPQFVENAGGTTTAVVNTDGLYKYVGRLVIEFDDEGNIIPESYDADVSGAYATDDQGVADLNAEDLVDPEIQQIVDEIEAQIIATESNVFGISNVFLNGNRTGTANPDDPDGVRTQETNLGNLTADANLAYANQVADAIGETEEVVLSIKNGGGIRASIGQTVVPPGGTMAERLPNEELRDSDGNIIKPEGGISQNDIAAALAFNNSLALLTLTKSEIVDLLEHGARNIGGGPFPQLSGVEFSYDPDLPAGNRIVSAAIVDETGTPIIVLVENGEIAGDANQTFRIVTLGFLADPTFDANGNFVSGGDGYPFPNLNDDPLRGEVGDPAVIARVNRVDLNDLNGDGVADGTTTGDATFAADGTEQDALAEFLADNHATEETAYDEADVGRNLDERIQNLNFREDTVLDGFVEPAPEFAINEIRIDQPGNDDDEFFELFGEAGASLAGLHYIVIGDGSGASPSGVIEAVVDLGAFTLDENGFFVAAESTFGLGTADATVNLNFENMDNVTHLLVRGFTGSNNQDLDTNDDGVLDIVPWTEIVDSVALIQQVGGGDQVYSDTRVGPDGSFVPGHVFRSPDGSGDFQIGGFDPDGGSDTPGAPNPVRMELAIFEIQGADHRSPHEGALVRSSGIVTAVTAIGFYMQDAMGDGDIATSDGIFVFTGGAPGLSVGNGVTVEGIVEEFQFPPALSVTQIAATSTTVTSQVNDLPDAVVLGIDRIQPNDVIDDDMLTSFDPEDDAIDFLESLEGMRIEVANPLVVAGTNGFGEIAVAAGRGGESGPGIANAVISEGDFNPEILLIDDVIITAPNATTGDTFTGNLEGVLDYTFGAYKLQLTEAPTVVSGGRTPDVTTLEGDAEHMTIATYNVLNLNPQTGAPGGADDRLDAIARTIVDNLGSPDIISLQEIQDNSGTANNGVVDASQTLQELTQAIFLAGGPFYLFAQINPENNEDGGAPGSNIRNAFLYNPERVELDSASLMRIEDSSFDNGGDGSMEQADYSGSRKPLVGEFTFLPTGESVTVVGNHFSSKGGDDGLFGENQPPVEVTLPQRVDQAEAVNSFVASLLATDPDANVVVLGDLNDFQFSDTLDALKNGNGGDAELINLVDSLPLEDQYTFIFNGNSQVLDHILVSGNLAADAEIDIVHTNLDFGRSGFVASDHDAILARLDLSDSMAMV